MSGNKQPAPLPRDYDDASFSEMMPFRSKKIRLFKSPIFYFVAVTAIFNVALFGLRVAVINGETVDAKVESFNLLVQIGLFYLLAVSLLAFHAYAKSDKPITYYIFPTLFVFLFMKSPLWQLIYIPFDILGLGNLMETSPDWLPRLWSAFAGPGLREELVKGMPTLFCAAMTVWAVKFKWVPPRIYKLIHVRTPLDGILMGFAAGCAFLFAETGGQYVHDALITSLKGSKGNLNGAFGDAMMLLLPRAMNGWVGHMAWAGTFGYFIGLAIIRPRHAWKLVGIGWVIAAALHGLWDSDPPGGTLALVVVGAAGGLLAIACLVKARQLEASISGRAAETFGSIVVDMPAPAAVQAFSPAPVSPVATRAPVAPPVVQPAPRPPPPVTPAVSTGFVMTIDSLRIPLQSGNILDLAAEPALAGRAQGVKAEVTRHPTNPDILGLKNLGTHTWYARLRDQTTQPVEAQRSLRIAAGVSVDFGGGLIAQIATA
jgi:hypothetical protein